MKNRIFFRRTPVVVLALSLGLCPVPLAGARDDVAIPKSRLEELLRKEAELERMKATPRTNAAPASSVNSQTTPSVVAPAVTRSSPPIASLPPLPPDEVVDASDLASHYSADAAVADQRYLKRHLRIRGEIAGFEKPLLTRDYRVILKTPDRTLRIVCDVVAPEKFNVVFSAKHGSEFVGMVGETRVPIAKLGDAVVLSGTCKGVKDASIRMSSCSMRLAR